MTISFAQGLGDLAGEDIRRWREGSVAATDLGRQAGLAARVIGMVKRIVGIEPMGRCRQPLPMAPHLVPISVPGPTHDPLHPRRPF